MRAAGWYKDPDNPATRRYWDGDRWVGRGYGSPAEDTAVLGVGYALSLLLPPLGFIAGLVVVFRGRAATHGIAMLAISAFALWWSWNYVL